LKRGAGVFVYLNRNDVTEIAPWLQYGIAGLTMFAMGALFRRNWAPGWVIEEKDARIKELEAEVIKWQDRTLEAVRAAKTVAVASTEAIRSQRDVAT
jgi:hypothetical protein